MTSRNEQPLEGQVAVVIGGSSGIGLATAAELAALGARAVVAARDQARLDAARAELPVDASAVRADMADPASLRRLAEAVGQVDHLVLAAGASDGIGAVKDLDLDALERGLHRKVVGGVAAVQAFVPVLSPGGSITFVGARSASRAAPGAVGLSAINGAVESLVASLAAELAPLRVNAVSPGVIDTPWWSGFPADMRGAVFDEYASATTVGRIGTAAEVAHAVAALVTNTFTSGIVLPVDGGAGA